MSLQVTFKTDLPPALKVASTPFAVPAKLSRSGLSEVVNHLLGLSTPQPFDFLVGGELLRTSLAEHLKKRGLSTETVLQLEYLLIPPKPTPSLDLPHDDWISDICGDVDSIILTGSYDGKARVWRDSIGTEEEPVALCTLEGHSDAITAVGWLSERSNSVNPFAVTASKDHTLRGWDVRGRGERNEKIGEMKVKPKDGTAVCAFRFVGHTDSVASISVTNDRSRFCTGSWDKSIKVWATPSLSSSSSSDVATHSKKKQKGATAAAVPVEMKNRGPLSTMIGHTQYVSAVQWGSAGQLFSGSWDHTIRVWDVENEIETSTLNGSKAVNAISVTNDCRLIASAHGDRLIRIWDPRASDSAVITTALASHKGWVSDVAFLPRSDVFLASSSFDHSVRLWDIRAAVATHTLAGHSEKAMCVAWASKNRLLSGGADGKVRCYSPWREAEQQ